MRTRTHPGRAGQLRRRRQLSRRLRAAAACVIIAGLFSYGAVLLGLGISGYSNENALAANGVPALAQVTATSGYGRDTIQVTYQVGGRQVQGTVTADPSSVHQGEQLAVVYDPSNPQVVSLAGDVGDTSSALGEVIVGSIVLGLFPLSVLLTLISRRRRRRRAIRAALGD